MSLPSNVPEFSVGDLAFSLKKTIEDTYGRVRVRGELSRVSIASSGHMYSSLKDDKALIDAVCWKGVLSKIAVRPEEGLEVICTGKISTYPQRSNYQLIIEDMELAGEGALLKMLEERKKKLAAEGLFDPSRKVPLPFLPQVIGVVTSPTGAVIRDILHRLADRFPVHVILWPAKVQGQGATEDIVAGIEGLQVIDQHGFPKPDVVIVARGGGSLEDLMAFNEESVVRAAAACDIPFISAVGHETDTTLLDYVADIRAPTPTGAAEMAVPVREACLAQVSECEGRLYRATERLFKEADLRLSHARQLLGDPARMIDVKAQHCDQLSEALIRSGRDVIFKSEQKLQSSSSRLRHPGMAVDMKEQSLENISARLSQMQARLLVDQKTKLSHLSQMLEAFSFQNVLKRGYAVVRSPEDHSVLTKPEQMSDGGHYDLEFYGDKRVRVTAGALANDSVNSSVRPCQKVIKKDVRKADKEKKISDQGSLF